MGDRKKVLVLMFGCEPIGVYGSLSDLCRKNKEFVYSTLVRRKPFPINYKKHIIYKIDFR